MQIIIRFLNKILKTKAIVQTEGENLATFSTGCPHIQNTCYSRLRYNTVREGRTEKGCFEFSMSQNCFCRINTRVHETFTTVGAGCKTDQKPALQVYVLVFNRIKAAVQIQNTTQCVDWLRLCCSVSEPAQFSCDKSSLVRFSLVLKFVLVTKTLANSLFQYHYDSTAVYSVCNILKLYRQQPLCLTFIQ